MDAHWASVSRGSARVVTTERRYLTHRQVLALADAAAAPPAVSKHRRVDERRNDSYRLIVLFLAYTGVRFGEMAALRVRRVDFLRRRATIAESVTLAANKQVWGMPKGHERREVPIPQFLIDELAAHVDGKKPDDLVFTVIRRGGALRAQIFRRAAFDRAAEEIGVPGLHPHELRHTAASLAIAAGANVKVIQQMLGHKSATMTLDQYGHLFGDQLDQIADALMPPCSSLGACPMTRRGKRLASSRQCLLRPTGRRVAEPAPEHGASQCSTTRNQSQR